MSRSSVQFRLSAPRPTALHLIAIVVSWLFLTGAAPGLQTVVIDPGHGGDNEGALCPHDNVREKVYVLKIAQAIATHLRAAGVHVVLTREDDRALAIAQRVKLANDANADLFVSVHLNSSPSPGPVG